MPKLTCFKITGDVQGVGMRFSIDRYAQENDLKGWVRNEIDRSVKCCFESSNQEIEEFTSWLKSNFSITNITAEQIEADGESDKFEIRY